MRYTNQSNISYESAMVATHWLRNLPQEYLEAEGSVSEAATEEENRHNLVGMRQRLKSLNAKHPIEDSVFAKLARRVWSDATVFCKLLKPVMLLR